MQFIVLESKFHKILFMILLVSISALIITVYLIHLQRQGIEVIKADSTKSIICSEGILNRMVGKEHILTKGDWFVTENPPFRIIAIRELMEFHPENCRVIEEENEHE